MTMIVDKSHIAYGEGIIIHQDTNKDIFSESNIVAMEDIKNFKLRLDDYKYVGMWGGYLFLYRKYKILRSI